MIDKPILLDIPDRLQTDRLELRAVMSGVGAHINRAVVESHAELSAWMPWANPCPSPEDTEIWCRGAHADFIRRETLPYHLYLKGTETFVGTSSIFNINWKVPSCEIGYWMHTPHTGKGYMTEGARALVRLAFEVIKAERVQIRCDDLNPRSAAVAERLGFVLEGIRRRDSRDPRGELRDTRVYAKVRQ
jgi:RimJ/RimL family protein N-acetyltransferase